MSRIADEIQRAKNNKIIKGYHIIIKVLKVIEFKGDNYYRDMQRLAFAEMELIEKYQQAGQCLWQLPEGTWISEEKWNKRYKKEPCPE